MYVFLAQGGDPIKGDGEIVGNFDKNPKRYQFMGLAQIHFSPLSGLKSLTLTPYFNKEIKNMPECILELKKHTGIMKNTREVLEKTKQHLSASCTFWGKSFLIFFIKWLSWIVCARTDDIYLHKACHTQGRSSPGVLGWRSFWSIHTVS